MRAVDAAIVGAGPAGSTLALLLARAGRSVALFHRTAAPRPIWEMLSPVAAQILGELELHRVLERCGAPCTGTVDTWEGDVSLWRPSITSPWGPAWHVDRGLFDAGLRDQAVRHGAWLVDRPARASVAGRGFSVRARGLQVEAQTLVDATGASAAIARSLGVRRRVLDHQIAFFRECRAATAALTIESRPAGWAYRSSSQLVVITDPVAGRSMRVGRARAAPVITQAIDDRLPPGLFVIGDASWTPDPLSGQGVARALSQARATAGHILQGGMRRGEQPLALAVEHLGVRAELCRRARWSSRVYYENRVRAWRTAQGLVA